MACAMACRTFIFARIGSFRLKARYCHTEPGFLMTCCFAALLELADVLEGDLVDLEVDGAAAQLQHRRGRRG